MTFLTIVEYPDERLEKVARPVEEVTDEIRALAADMAQTMYAAPGVGLAAPQVGRSLRLIVIDVSEKKDTLLTLVNPRITAHSDEEVLGEEGCLSLPGMYEDVRRFAEVEVAYTDLEGRPQTLQAQGLLAVCLQHEIDHLDGVVFIDHVSRLKKMRVCAKLRKRRLEKARAKADA